MHIVGDFLTFLVNRHLRCFKWLEGYGKAKQDVLIQCQTHHGAMEPCEPIEITKNVSHLLNVNLHIVGDFSHWIGFLCNAVRSRQTEKHIFPKCTEVHACEFIALGSIGASSCACTTVVICWKTAQFGSREPIGSDFSATRYDLGKRRNSVCPNMLKFMLASL